MLHKKASDISKKREEQFMNESENPQQLPLIEDEIKARIRRTKKEIYKIGELLVKAKSLVPPGKFKSWIKENFEDLSYPTAVNFMRVYKCCLGRPSIVQTIGISILYQITAPSFPRDLRKHIFEHGDIPRKIRNKDMKEIAERFKRGELNTGSPEIKNLLKFNQDMRKYNEYEKNIIERIEEIKSLRDKVTTVADKFEWPIHIEKQKPILNEEQRDEVNCIVLEIQNAAFSLLPEEDNENIKPMFEIVR